MFNLKEWVLQNAAEYDGKGGITLTKPVSDPKEDVIFNSIIINYGGEINLPKTIEGIIVLNHPDITKVIVNRAMTIEVINSSDNLHIESKSNFKLPTLIINRSNLNLLLDAGITNTLLLNGDNFSCSSKKDIGSMYIEEISNVKKIRNFNAKSINRLYIMSRITDSINPNAICKITPYLLNSLVFHLSDLKSKDFQSISNYNNVGLVVNERGTYISFNISHYNNAIETFDKRFSKNSLDLTIADLIQYVLDLLLNNPLSKSNDRRSLSVNFVLDNQKLLDIIRVLQEVFAPQLPFHIYEEIESKIKDLLIEMVTNYEEEYRAIYSQLSDQFKVLKYSEIDDMINHYGL